MKRRRNPHYPDLDDTAVVVMAMERAQRIGAGDRYNTAIKRGAECADHGALIDPPTDDVTARCVSMLAQLGETRNQSQKLSRGVDYLLSRQLAEGSWYGRWGMNYIYGTWSVLCALNA